MCVCSTDYQWVNLGAIHFVQLLLIFFEPVSDVSERQCNLSCWCRFDCGRLYFCFLSTQIETILLTSLSLVNRKPTIAVPPADQLAAARCANIADECAIQCLLDLHHQAYTQTHARRSPKLSQSVSQSTSWSICMCESRKVQRTRRCELTVKFFFISRLSYSCWSVGGASPTRTGVV